MEFNSLDAQREAAENYIASQRENGWVCLPEHYDDGGFSGGNMNRPALKQLLLDAEAGKLDLIVVYKIDRLSRSLCDFAELNKMFDKWGVAFVSVTQEINTNTSRFRRCRRGRFATSSKPELHNHSSMIISFCYLI